MSRPGPGGCALWLVLFAAGAAITLYVVPFVPLLAVVVLASASALVVESLRRVR